ncbi:MAG: DUF6069 family protein [Myxococcota bacterium]
MNTTLDVKAAAKGAALGGFVAGVVCVGIYFLAAAIGADFRPRDPAAMGGMEVLPFFQPMVNCLIAAVVSIVLVAILAKLAGTRAWSIYVGIAVAVFLVELYLPFWAFADMKTIAALELMHVPATLGVVGGIYTARRPIR